MKCSGIKTSEDGGGLILRVYDADGKGGPVTAGFMKPVCTAELVDFTENKRLGGVEILDGKVCFYLPAYQTAALKVGF